MTYEALQALAADEELEVIEMSFPSGLDGVIKDKKIAINKSSSIKHKKCILAEELGHYYTASGNIVDQNDIINRKIELKGRQWGYLLLVPLKKLIRASKEGITNLYELAEYLDITESFLKEALTYYESKYGLFVELDDYCICFNPLVICKYNFE